MSKFEPSKVLNRILNRLCQIDRYGYFALPVTEAEAPGYYSVIEKPMCFSTMREKIDTRQYRTWGSFLADFSLMLRNALYFNDKKSTVYRVALTLNKEGNERLREVDVEGRQAIYLLHPGGPAAAAEEEAQEFEARQQIPPMNPFLIVPPETPCAKKSPLEMEDLGMELETEGYSSYSETESEGDMRGQGCPSVMKMQTTLNVHSLVKHSAQFWLQEGIEGGVQYEMWREGTREESLEEKGRCEWGPEKTRIERRCLSLQLRMVDLQASMSRYRALSDAVEEEEAVKYSVPRAELGDWLLDSSKESAESAESDAGDSCEDESYPGRLYLTLGILAEETTKLTALLSSRQRISQSRMFSTSRPIKKSTSLRKKPSSSTEILEPKRSRRDFDVALHHSDSFGTTGSIERPIKVNITVPTVIEITPEKAEKWENAKRMLKQSLEHDPDATMPQEVMQALQLSADEGSSEEDISDDLYLTKHQQMELAERERHLCVLSGLDPKRRKLPEKRMMRSASFQAPRAPPKRGRGRGRGAGRPGRPPGQRRSPPADTLDTLHPQQPWMTSLPMTRPLTGWSSSAMSILPFPVFPAEPEAAPSLGDVTSGVPTTTASQ